MLRKNSKLTAHIRKRRLQIQRYKGGHDAPVAATSIEET